MPRNVLLVGTRKGLFVLESDGDRRDWKARGPYCEAEANAARAARDDRDLAFQFRIGRHDVLRCWIVLSRAQPAISMTILPRVVPSASSRKACVACSKG